MTAAPPPDPAHSVTVEILGTRPEEHPGVVALLLDHAERRGLRLSWHSGGPVDDQLEFRLAFGRHELVAEAVGPPTAPPLATDPLRWLQQAQLAVGAAVRGQGPVRLVLDLAQLDRADAFSVVAEVLDLIEGLVTAGRVSTRTVSEIQSPGAD